MASEIGIPIKKHETLLQKTFVPITLEDIITKQHIVKIKNPFLTPYGDFYFISSKDMNMFSENKQFIIKLLQDSHLKFWRSPECLQTRNQVVSSAYLITLYYTDIIMTEILNNDCTVTLFNEHQTNKDLLFSIATPFKYFESVYEVIEKCVTFDKKLYTFKVFQRASLIRKKKEGNNMLCELYKYC